MKANSPEFCQAVALILDGDENQTTKVQRIVTLARSCEETSYVAGTETARRMVRFQLGLATDEDRKWAS